MTTHNFTAEGLMGTFHNDKDKVINFLIAQCNKGNMTMEEGSDLGDQIYEVESTSSIGDVKAEEPPVLTELEKSADYEAELARSITGLSEGDFGTDQ